MQGDPVGPKPKDSVAYRSINIAQAGLPLVAKRGSACAPQKWAAPAAHGLGHLRAPYGAENAAIGIPKPQVELSKIGVELWQHDLWHRIVSAALEGRPDQPDLRFHPALNLPAVSRYAATTPQVLKWFDAHNRSQPYHRQVRPFGFLVSLFAKGWSADTATALDQTDRRKRPPQIRPVAPFTREPVQAAETAFDRETRSRVPREALKSYRQLLASYHLHPEAKFLNGDFTDVGPTTRRHVVATNIRHIGKEANKWEQQFFTGIDDEAGVDYGSPGLRPAAVVSAVRIAADRVGHRAFASMAGVSERHLSRILAGRQVPSRDCVQALLAAVLESTAHEN